MKVLENKIRCRFAAMLLAAVLLSACTGGAFAENDDSGVTMSPGDCTCYETITTRFYEIISDEMREFSVNYSDEFFQRDDDVFYLDLARASFGMAWSAFRNKSDDADVAEDVNIISFFTQAGFENPESTWYDRQPAADSIATVIAQKKIGDVTVVALVACGGRYGDEWLSNLTVGSGTEHEGFSSAATVCEKRLQDYLQRYELTGDLKLWIAGYSRAAAVGNLLAARMTEAGLFTSVYGYFFATPDNTQNPVAWPNIFNVIGQYDPVSQLPLTAWGYGRNGVDLYTPSQEANSSYLAEGMLASGVFSEITGQSFRNNPELNQQLHVVFEYLAQIFPTAQSYAELLQPQLLSVWRQHSDRDLIVLLGEALDNIKGFDPGRQSAIDALKDYLDQVIYDYISGNEYQTKDGSWNADDTLGVNIALEHTPAIYASWLFSTDDPAQLFVSSTKTLRLVIEGSFDLEVWDDAGIVQSISSENEEAIYVPGGEARAADADAVYLYASNHDGKAVINLPCDREYTLKLRLKTDDTVTLFSTETAYCNGTKPGGDILAFDAAAGDCIVLKDFFDAQQMQVTTENGAEVPCLYQKLNPDAMSVLVLEQLMGRNISLSHVMKFTLLLAGLLLGVLLAALVFALAGRKRKRFRAVVTVCFMAAGLVLCVGAVFFSDVLPNVPLLTAGLAVLSFGFGVIGTVRLIQSRARGT